MFCGVQTRGVRSYSYHFYIVFYHKFLHHFWFVCLCIVAYKNCLHFLISVKLCFILQYLGNKIPHTCWINSLQRNKQSIYPIPGKSYNCTNARVVSICSIWPLIPLFAPSSISENSAWKREFIKIDQICSWALELVEEHCSPCQICHVFWFCAFGFNFIQLLVAHLHVFDQHLSYCPAAHSRKVDAISH